MASKACPTHAESEDTLPTEYSIYGPSLNVDALLSRSRPRGTHSVWRKGEVTELVRPRHQVLLFGCSKECHQGHSSGP